MKKTSKIISVLLACVMATAALAGCGAEKETSD